MFRAQHLKRKEVIAVETGERIGYVGDVEIDSGSGCIEAIIVPRTAGLFRLFLSPEIVIPWNMIAVVGKDAVLVRTVKGSLENSEDVSDNILPARKRRMNGRSAS